MQMTRTIVFLLAISAVVMVWGLPCYAESQGQEKKEDIWKEGPKGPPRRGPRFELTNEEISRLMKSLKERDPKKAKELAKLREKDPQKFQAELRRVAREEFGRIIRERIEQWRRKRWAEFTEWLGKSYRKEAEELAKLKDQGPDVYNKKFNLLYEKYGRIFEAARRSPELAEVLKADLELKKRRDEILVKLKATRDENKRKKLTTELEEVISSRFDLIVRRKEIAYERLLKRLEELKEEIKRSRDELVKWGSKRFKDENVKKRAEELIKGIPKFEWD